MNRSRVVERNAIDQGLRQFLLGVYNYMGLGLALTALVVMSINLAPLGVRSFFYAMGLPASLAALGLSFFFSFSIAKMKTSTAQMIFWLYAALMGVSLSRLLSFFPLAVISQAFFVTAFTFIGASFYGFATKKDLAGWGRALSMVLIGLLVASVMQMFFGGGALHFVISLAGVGLFTALTAYDTQRLKALYYQIPAQADFREKVSVLGALALYLDALNIFLFLLDILSPRRD